MSWGYTGPVHGTDFTGDKGFTVQSQKDEADINKIVNRVLKAGVMPPSRGGEPFYGDVSDLVDLQSALIKVQEADELFMQFPAEVRERFGNDPVDLIEFLGDDKNREEAEKLGLVQRRPVEGLVAGQASPSVPEQKG